MFFAAYVAVEPDVEPVRRIFGDDAGKRSRVRRADEHQAALLQRLAEAKQRGFDIGQMLDDVVADDEVEAVGREAVDLDVAEDRLLRVVVVADLVRVDIDHRDVGATQHLERQEAGRAAAGFVDPKPGCRQPAAENAVNREQAVARLAGRQFEQRLRMFERRRGGRDAQIGRNSAGAAWVRSMVAVLLTCSYPMLMLASLVLKNAYPNFSRRRVCEISSSQHIAT